MAKPWRHERVERRRLGHFDYLAEHLAVLAG